MAGVANFFRRAREPQFGVPFVILMSVLLMVFIGQSHPIRLDEGGTIIFKSNTKLLVLSMIVCALALVELFYLFGRYWRLFFKFVILVPIYLLAVLCFAIYMIVSYAEMDELVRIEKTRVTIEPGRRVLVFSEISRLEDHTVEETRESKGGLGQRFIDYLVDAKPRFYTEKKRTLIVTKKDGTIDEYDVGGDREVKAVAVPVIFQAARNSGSVFTASTKETKGIDAAKR